MFRPKYFIVNDIYTYRKLIKNKRGKTKIINNFRDIPLKMKFDITISAIVGIAGLEPTINFMRKSKKILLANKESIICVWHICTSTKDIKQVIPIDSEHFYPQLTK